MRYYNIVLLIFLNLSYVKSFEPLKNLFVSHDKLSIFIQNDKQTITFIWNPLSSNRLIYIQDWGNHFFTSKNVSITFVYDAVIEKYANKDTWILGLIGEDKLRNIYFIIVEIKGNESFDKKHVFHQKLNQGYGLNQFAIGIHPHGRYACVVEMSSTICYDLKEEKVNSYSNSLMWTKGTFIFGQSLVITSDDRLFLLAYCLIEANANKTSETITLNILSADLIDLSNPIFLSKTELSIARTTSEYFMNKRKYSLLSFSFDDQSKKMIVGIACISQVVILSALNRLEPAKIIKEHNSTDSTKYFGKSVVMLDENRYAVLIPSMISSRFGCSSQIQFYSLEDKTTKPKPIFVFPNNQQLIQIKPHLLTIPSIVSLSKWNSYGINIVLDTSTGILMQSSSPGYYSGEIETWEKTDIQIYHPVKCLPGTYQNGWSLEPCSICPSETKNNGSFGDNCEKCVETKTLICFPGSKKEINISEMLVNDELKPFPESSDSTQFEDILLQNMLTLSTSSFYCFIRSPTSMASITLFSLGIVYILITFIFNNLKYKNYPIIVRKIFGHFDLITEKEYYFGGFMTISILVIIACACLFSSSYSQLYPIEQITIEKQQSCSCDQSLINAKFSSSLQLVSIRKHVDEKPIFDLLEKQPIRLDIHLISTNFRCKDLLVQENRGQGLSIPWTDSDCSSDDIFLNISTILHEKSITLEFDLNGPHIIGALFICLSAPPFEKNHGKYVVSEMKHCQFYYNQNETLSSNPNINIKIVKIVNRTISRTLQDNINYSATWLPIFTSKTFNDHLLFAQKGEYYRYLNSKVSLLIDISQSEFYVKNTQEPIARRHEIIFTTILFSMLCLDLIALYFTVLRMLIVPFFYLIKKHFFIKQVEKS